MKTVVQQLLKDRGQFLFTDYVLADDVQVKDQGDGSKSGPQANHFWTAKRYESYLEKHKFDVRINEDITDDFRKLITNAWSSFIKAGIIETLAPQSAHKVLREAEFWTNRMRAIEEGSLKVQRLYAIKKFSS